MQRPAGPEPGDPPRRGAGSARLLRAMNTSAALAHLLDHGPLTRAELVSLTGLSKPTASDVLRRLARAGLASVVGHTSGGPGPQAEIYAPAPRAGYAAAVCLRPARPAGLLVGALCDLTGTVVARAAVDPDTDGASPAGAVAGLVQTLRAGAEVPPGAVRHVQLGVPGAYDRGDDTIRHIDVPGWGRPGLVGELARRLGTPLDVENDVNLAAVAERSRGAAGQVDSFVLLWCGAGLGLAVDVGGRLLPGAHGGAGEIGYLPVRPDGPRATLQDLVGGPAVSALAARYGVAAAAPGPAGPDPAPRPGVGPLAATRPPDPVRAVAGAVAALPQPAAAAFLDELAGRIAYGLAAVVAILDPYLIVLAGEVGRAGGRALADRVAAALRARTPWRVRITPSGVPDDPVLAGAVEAGSRAVRRALVDGLRRTGGAEPGPGAPPTSLQLAAPAGAATPTPDTTEVTR